MAFSRRALFGRGAAAVAAVPALAGPSGAALRLTGIEAAAGTALTAGYADPVGSKPLQFLSFASWLKDIGHERLRKEAQQVRFIDADLASMRLPLSTLVRWQQERNYRALLAEKETWFDRTLRDNGRVDYWP